MADNIIFKTGNIDTKVPAIKKGQILFSVNNKNKGEIFFDKDDSTRVSMGGGLLGEYVSNTAVSDLPEGITYIEMPATPTVTGDPVYGTLITVKHNVNRAFQLANNNNGDLYYRVLHQNFSSDTGPGYGPWKRLVANTGEEYNIISKYTKQIYGTLTNPASNTSYNIPFIEEGSLANYKHVRYNNGLNYKTSEGTTTAEGSAILILGNATSVGTAGNKRGRLRLMNSYSTFSDLMATGNTSSTSYLPAFTGYLLYKPNSSAVGSSSQPVYIDSTGAATAISSLDLTGSIAGDTITIKDNDQAKPHLIFSRAGWNYITSPTGSTIAFVPTGASNSSQTRLAINGTAVFPGNNTGIVDLGTSNYKWNNVYANSFSGNAATATKLATARTINGTSFDGTSNITTANWGTARTLTIGNKGQSVNGSSNVYWSLNDIGALSLTGGTLTGTLTAPSYVTSKTYSANPDGTAEGWYRCATLISDKGTSNNFILSIRRTYYSPENEGYLFAISNEYDVVNITQISGSTGGHILSKIRANIDGDGKIHIDYYMVSNGTASYKNTWYISGWGDGTVYAPYLVSSYTGTVTEFDTVNGLKNNAGITGTLSGTATAVRDKTNNTATYLNYGASGLSTTSWFAAWNGYELRGISPTNSRITMSALSATNANGYYGMGTPDGTTSTWIRTTTLGIIPYQSGGSSALGTSGWPFSNAYINTVYGNLSGNASTATALTTSAGSTAQAIYFSGGKPVAIDWHIGNANVGEHNCNNITYNMIGYYTSNGPTTSLGATTSDGSIYSQAYSSSWVSQIAQDYRDGALFVRGKNNGTWTNWLAILDSSNYTSYTVTKTGSGASGTWGINVTGTAAAFSSNRTIALTGAVTGSVASNGASGWSIATTIAGKVITPTNFTTAFRTQTKGNANAGTYFSVIRSNTADSWGYMPQWSSGIAFGHSDTHGYLYVNYGGVAAYLGGGSADKLNWVRQIAFTDGTGASGTWGISVTGSSGSCTGNAATASSVAWSGITSKPSYYDAKAIKGITRSGTTFTYTCMDGTTGTFTQQDNNTTYSAGNGLSLSSTTFSVSYGTSASTLGTSSAGSATTVSRSDHVHALPALTSCTGTLTVAKGGTGATNKSNARINLGISSGTSLPSSGSAGDIFFLYA